jgi:hypothetical protein
LLTAGDPGRLMAGRWVCGDLGMGDQSNVSAGSPRSTQATGRWWGKSGHDYKVQWADGSSSWHLSKHLTKQAGH